MSAILIIGVGVPGCGKTTLLKPLAERLGIGYISSDDIRERLTGDANNHTKEREVWTTLYKEAADALKRNGVIVDATFTAANDRKRLIRAAEQLGITEIKAYWFNVPLEVCMKRNNVRQRIVPHDVILKMYERLMRQPPSLEEGFTEVIEVTS